MPDSYSLISVDLDDLWTHYQLHSGAADPAESILEPSVANAMQAFAEFGIRATFFIVAKDVVDRPALMKRICEEIGARGHEVANHGFWHKPYGSMRPDDAREDILSSTLILKEIAGKDVVGFRSPSWGLNENVIRTLEELGYEYDASLFPSPLAGLFRRYLSWRTGVSSDSFFGGGSPSLGSVLESRLQVFPLSIAWMLPFYSTIHMYSRLGRGLFRLQAPLALRSAYCSYIFHAIDFVDTRDYRSLFPFYRISNTRKKERLYKILARLSESRKCVPMREFADAERQHSGH